MRCSICGHEFGDGNKCCNCGADRVSAGAEYLGYQKPITNQQGASSPVVTSLSGYNNRTNTVCPFCGEVIPDDAKYCPFCAKALYVDCPNCNYHYPSRYPVCPSCGTNREYFEANRQEIERQRLLFEQEQERKRREEKNWKDKLNWRNRQKCRN